MECAFYLESASYYILIGICAVVHTGQIFHLRNWNRSCGEKNLTFSLIYAKLSGNHPLHHTIISIDLVIPVHSAAVSLFLQQLLTSKLFYSKKHIHMRIGIRMFPVLLGLVCFLRLLYLHYITHSLSSDTFSFHRWQWADRPTLNSLQIIWDFSWRIKPGHCSKFSHDKRPAAVTIR